MLLLFSVIRCVYDNEGFRNLFFSLVVFYAVMTSSALESADFHKNLPAKLIWAVPGKDVELPCDVTPPVPSDAVNMVFWFKDNTHMPLYSLDARGGPLDQASHLATVGDIGQRAYFIARNQSSMSYLKISKITPQDEGIFRCRVDFINSPTRNFKVNLSVVVQPSPPRIFDAQGREVIGEAGPFLEGHELFLSCQVTGGRPSPSLTWWYNGSILDSVVDTTRNAFTTVNQLYITKVSRSLKGHKLECRASSLEIAGDIIREVPIIVYLKPNKVKIVELNDLLSVNKPQTCRCETSGSYPPAKLSWFLDGKPLRQADIIEEETEAFSSSILSLNVQAKDDGKELVCRADNLRFPGGSVEDRRQIHVAYPPKVAVRLESGSTLPIKEGAKVLLRCDIVARPSPHSYSWYHDGHLVPYNETAGILPIDHILTLKYVSKTAEGQYSCSAMNSEGETYSPPFSLVVQYAPRCRKGYEVMRVGALPNETLVVQCHVDAIPEVTRFSWTFNTSKGVFPVQGAKMENKNSISTLQFQPGSTDLESLSCWASNNVGRQSTPCLFYIVPADYPEPPQNCHLRNASNGLEVVCLAGKDGGLQQSFVLEVTDLSAPAAAGGITTLSDQGYHSPPLYRVLGDTPVFRLHSLEPGREYQLFVYAVNAKGASAPPVVLSNIRVRAPIDGLTKKDNEKPPSDEQADERAMSENLTIILVGLAAAAGLLIVGIITVAVFLACRKQQSTVVMRQRRTSKPNDDLELSEAGFGEGFLRRSAQYRASLYAQEIEPASRQALGPDLILSPVSLPLQTSDY